jgi:hypothetical protein
MRLDHETAVRLRAAFPAALRGDVDLVLERLPTPTHAASADDVGDVNVSGERVSIPARVYLPASAFPQAGELDARRRRILACICTRDHDGRVRESAVREILPPRYGFEGPFIVQLLGEHVVEIAQVILANIDELRTPEFQTFILENEPFLARTRQRATSYWDCYYRQSWNRCADYPGVKALDKLAVVQ